MRVTLCLVAAGLTALLLGPVRCSDACTADVGECSTDCQTLLGYRAPLGEAGWIPALCFLVLAALLFGRSFDRRT